MDVTAPTVGSTVGSATGRLAAAGIDTPRLDAEILLAWVLGLERSSLLAHPDAIVGTGQVERFDAAIARRLEGEPVAYIRGMREFHGAVLSVDPRVLIPRPETETLVDVALERIRGDMTGSPRGPELGPYRVWDIGTGSGAIAIALASELRRLRYGTAVAFHLSDTSEDALAVALVNVVAHGLADHLTVARGDLDDVTPRPEGQVDLVVANLPYIPSADMGGLPVPVRYEPSAALDGGPDGLDVIRRLLGRLPAIVRPGGAALLEVGAGQDEALLAAAAAHVPGWETAFVADLAGIARVAQLERPR